MVETSDKQQFACGCVTWSMGDKFLIRPCSATCSVLSLVVALTDEDKKPLRLSTTEDVEI